MLSLRRANRADGQLGFALTIFNPFCCLALREERLHPRREHVFVKGSGPELEMFPHHKFGPNRGDRADW